MHLSLSPWLLTNCLSSVHLYAILIPIFKVVLQEQAFNVAVIVFFIHQEYLFLLLPIILYLQLFLFFRSTQRMHKTQLQHLLLVCTIQNNLFFLLISFYLTHSYFSLWHIKVYTISIRWIQNHHSAFKKERLVSFKIIMYPLPGDR